MPLFRKKAKPSFSPAAFRSVEHLPSTISSSSAPRVAGDDDFNRSFAGSTLQQSPPQDQSQAHQQQPPPRHPAHSHSPLQRSRTQRLRTPPDPSNYTTSLSTNTSTVPVSNDYPPLLAPPQSIDADVSDQSWPSSPTDKPTEDPEPRRSRRSLFSFHTTSSSSVQNQPSLVERNRSVKHPSVSTRRQSQQPQHQQQQQPSPPQHQQHQQQPQQPRLSVDTWSRDYVVDSTETEHQSSMLQSTGRSADPRAARTTHLTPVSRSDTDSNNLENLYRQPPIEPSRHAGDLAPGSHQLDPSGPRPPSRQSLGPPSPLPPIPQHETSSVSQLSTMTDRPSGGPQQNQAPPGGAHPPFPQGGNQEAGFRNNASGQQGPDPGRSTPTSRDSRSRDDVSDVDIRALVQKHDELQAKYSKVKRYYFERDAQVQQLQNTVAHQRMAVSRTVLDDNEYANRFGRLDGAIKDLAFSIRREWKTLPHWLTGFVNEDAPTTGTKEMTAIGRAVMSRWLVDELFECYFHPVLEPTFSRQLKSIEMNLRRQQTNTYTEEDKENSIARISNWRRTTLDGLTEALHGPAADEYRSQLIDRLVDNLVVTLVTNLRDPPPQGLDNGARMIVENAVGIAEKVPLESRDICVDYILPGTPIHEPSMKIEAGILPPLTTAAAIAISTPPGDSSSSTNINTTRHSGDQHRNHPHDSDNPPPLPEKDDEDRNRDASSGSTNHSGPAGGQESVPPRDQRMRSVFNFMGRKPGQGPATPGPAAAPAASGEPARRGSIDDRRTPGPPGTAASNTSAAGGGNTGTGAGAVPPPGRIRFASFITAEVRGRGPLNVLVKAPVYPID